MTSYFWSANIDCQKPYFNFSPPYNLRITNASLHFETKKEGKNVLEIIIDGKKHPICTLSLGGIEQTPLNLFFYAKSNLYFTANGNGKISICGNFLPEDEEDDDGEEGEYSYDDVDEEDEMVMPGHSLIEEIFGEGIIDSSDDEEYEQYSSEEFNYELVNKPRIEVLNSSEEIEEEKKEKEKTNNSNKNASEKVNSQSQNNSQPQNNSQQKDSQKKKRKLNSEVEKKKKSPNKIKKVKFNKESDIHQVTPRNKGIFLNSNYRKIPHEDFFIKDLTGSHEKKIQVGSLVHLYIDIYDNNHNKLYSSEQSNPISFHFGVNNIVDFLQKTVGEMRFNCLKIIKLSTYKIPPHRRDFFKKNFNLKIQPSDEPAFIYLKVCPTK